MGSKDRQMTRKKEEDRCRNQKNENNKRTK
jgi:hypothetical protein